MKWGVEFALLIAIAAMMLGLATWAVMLQSPKEIHETHIGTVRD